MKQAPGRAVLPNLNIKSLNFLNKIHRLAHKIQACCFESNAEEVTYNWSRGVAVITSASHAEGRRFDPGRDLVVFPFAFPSDLQ